MKKALGLSLFALATLTGCGCRHVRVAEDITPGNYSCCEKLDGKYGATDIRIQTCKITRQIFDRWYIKSGYVCTDAKPRIIITEVDNRTDCYISTDMIRDIFEGVAADDGRFTIVAGDGWTEAELDYRLNRSTNDPKYRNDTRAATGNVTAPQFLAKIRITKAKTAQPRYDLEDYRMQVTLYDIETQEIVDSAWDVLQKKVWR
jgi:hypothetical protein